MKIARLVALLALLAPLIIAPLPAAKASSGQPADARAAAAAILDNLTDQEKIAQLFLVTFTGSSLDPAAPIFQILRRYHLGGVVLTRANDNFDDRTDVRAARFFPDLISCLKWRQPQRASQQPAHCWPWLPAAAQ